MWRIGHCAQEGNKLTIHSIKRDNHTIHGTFSVHHEPILHIQSGDSIESPTLDAGWGLEAPHLDGTPRKQYSHPEKSGHALTGPIWIEGASVGMTLCVHIEEIIVGDYGFTIAGGFPHRINEAMGFVGQKEELLVWTLDKDTMTGVNQYGQKLMLKPFLGVMGMPPPEDGYHPTAPPRIWGGNMDCKELVAGTKLYLPIPVQGGLFSFGDGHARQGHGEVSVTAIECPIERVRLRLEVLPTMTLTNPRAWTPEGWLTFGFDENLEKATMTALDEMVSLMVEQQYATSRKQALALATAIVDLHITQIANPTMGVHAFLPHNTLLA